MWHINVSKLLNNPEKFLYVGGSLSGKRKFSDEFTTEKYFIQKKLGKFNQDFDYSTMVIDKPKVEYYYPRSLKAFDPKYGEKVFYFMVNDPYMTDTQLMEKLINGHRGVRRK